MRETIQEQSELELPNQNGLCRCGSHGLSMFSKCGWPTWQSCLTYFRRQGHGGVTIVYSASPRYRIISFGVPFLPPKRSSKILMSNSDVSLKGRGLPWYFVSMASVPSPESRTLILCLVYTRQSKGISCASSNSNIIRSGGSRRRDYSINTNTVVMPRKGRLLSQRNLASANMIVVGTMLLQITYGVQKEPAHTSMHPT